MFEFESVGSCLSGQFSCVQELLILILFSLSVQAFWNWVENYPDEFTMLYQRPQADMAGVNGFKPYSLTKIGFCEQRFSLLSNVTFCFDFLFAFPNSVRVLQIQIVKSY